MSCKWNIIKKLLAILFTIVGIAFAISEWNSHIKYVQSLDKFSNHLFSYTESMIRQNRVIMNAVDGLLKSSHPENPSLLKTICKSITEDGISHLELAEAYNCLAQIDLLNNDEISIYSAIKNTSYALMSFEDPKYSKNLANIITNGFAVEFPNGPDELENLTQLSKSTISAIRARALYRMSLIYQSDLKHINLSLAAKLQNQVLELIKFKKRKNIDVAFALNDKYINYAKTTIASILLSSDLDSDYNFYIIMDPKEIITAELQEELKNLQYLRPYKIEFKAFPTGIVPENSIFTQIKPQLLLFKTLSEKLFSNLSSIILLDVDILVQRDLYNLQNQEDLSKFVLAGVLSDQKLGETECNFPYTYINGGVLVQNLAMMKKINNTQAVLAKFTDLYTNNRSCIAQAEQDLINLLYSDQIKHISNRWNYIPVYDTSTKLMPFIIHYAGAKPWSPRYKKSPPAHIKLYQQYWDLVNKK